MKHVLQYRKSKGYTKLIKQESLQEMVPCPDIENSTGKCVISFLPKYGRNVTFLVPNRQQKILFYLQ